MNTLTPIDPVSVYSRNSPGIVYKKLDTKDPSAKIQPHSVVLKGNRWIPVQSIFNFYYCHNTQKWDGHSSSPIMVVIELDKEEPSNLSKAKTGYASYNPTKNIEALDGGGTLRNRKNCFFLTPLLAIRAGWFPHPCTDVWINPDKITTAMLTELAQNRYTPLSAIGGRRNLDSLSHHADETNRLYVDTLKMHAGGNKKDIEELVSAILLGYKIPAMGHNHDSFIEKLMKYSMGVEFETSLGVLPFIIAGAFKLVPLRDGSLPSGAYEYSTLPLEGLAGYKELGNAAQVLHKTCKVNTQCALHFHIGNYPRDHASICHLVALFIRLQDELFGLVPLYKKSEVAIAKKTKDYSAPLPSMDLFSVLEDMLHADAPRKAVLLEEFYANILALYNGSKKPKAIGKKAEFFEKAFGEKWTCGHRYRGLNLVPFYTSNSGTIEYRFLAPTVEPTRVLFWAILLQMITRYAQEHGEIVMNPTEKINLRRIINSYHDNTETGAKIITAMNSYVKILSREQTNIIIDAQSAGRSQSDGLSAVNSALIHTYDALFRTEVEIPVLKPLLK